MIHRIEISTIVFDTRASVRKKILEKSGRIKNVGNISITDVYTVDKDLTSQQLKAAVSILTNPVTQKAEIYSSGKRVKIRNVTKFTYAIEIGYLPGVTDNVGATAKESIEDFLKLPFAQDESVYSSQITFLTGNLSKKEAERISYCMANPLIQRIHIKSYQEYMMDEGMDVIVPRVKLQDGEDVQSVDLDIPDDELMQIGKHGIADPEGSRRGPLALSLTSLHAIRKYFKKLKRNPTDIELESLAQTWSEHCKHTIFSDPIDDIYKGLFQTFIKGATDTIRRKMGKKDICVSVFSDNSGAINFDDTYAVTHKVETHNSPSALDPFGGAITGIVGVNRDALGFGLGAKPVANTYGFCLANPDDHSLFFKDNRLTEKMLPPDRIMSGVIYGVNSGGNCSGIPTPQGFLYFDDRFRAKPLIFVGTVGLIPKKISRKSAILKMAKPGDYIVMIGGRVGLDGIHGATFSSVALDLGSPATAVQIGDPITQKKFSDAVVREARNRYLYNSITDNGAGGLSCSVSEMARESGGCEVLLECVPLKYPHLTPWQIWISESQERMTLAVPSGKWKKFSELMKRRGVETTIIGKFTKTGRCIVKYKKNIVMDIDLDFLHNGLPKKHRKSSKIGILLHDPSIPEKHNLTEELCLMLSKQNIASYEFISRQYDHEVQGSSVLKPLQGKGLVNSDSTVLRPVLGSKKGLVLSQGLYPRYGDIDSYHMAACAIDTAVRNVVVSGADPSKIALLDNFCWCSSDDPERLYQLKQAVRACYDYAVIYDTPFISGKDSMFNDFYGYSVEGKPVKLSIPPTVLISSIGIIDNVLWTVSLDVKMPGDRVYILGDTYNEIGGSEYLDMLGEKSGKKLIGESVPYVIGAKNRKLYYAYAECIRKQIISSAISVSRGGLGVALAKEAIGGMLGIDISLKNLPGTMIRDDYALFSESQGRIVATVSPKNISLFENFMKGCAYALIGNVTDDSTIVVRGVRDTIIIKTDVSTIKQAYTWRFQGY